MTVTIIDTDFAAPDPNAVTFSAADVVIIEGNAGSAVAVPFTIRLSRASSSPVTVPWATADGSAVAPDDYTAASGVLTFAPGETMKTIEVVVVGDSRDELEETFTLVLGNATTATCRILDDDAPETRKRTTRH